ncbi:MAG: peptidylprolyl isomerase [Gammaproteobacteria bacterium]
MKHKTLLIVAAFALVAAGCGEQPDTASTGGGDKPSQAADATTTTAAANGEKAVAVVNGVRIPESRIAQYASAAGDIPEGQRLAIIENIINSELISQQAQKNGLREELSQQIIIAEQTVLGRAYITKFLDANPVDEADLVALYETLTQGANANEYNVAHILVDDEAQANALLAQVLASPDAFAKLATTHSKDPGSAQNGGVLGWIPPGSLVPPFAEAMQKTGKGKTYPEVVKTDFGWHIIRVDDIREADIPPLDDQIRGQLRQQAQAQKVAAHLQELADAAEIERMENSAESEEESGS